MNAYEEILKTKTIGTIKNGHCVWKAMMVLLDNYRTASVDEGTTNEYLNALHLLSETFEYTYFREYLDDILQEIGSVDISKVEEVLK